MANRIFYAVQQLSIGPDGLNTYQVVRGVQSVAMTTTFNLEQAFQMGQLELFENIEGVPNIEMTVNRLLDGSALLYVLASATNNTQATTYARASDINLASSNKTVLKLGIWDEATYSYATSNPTNEVSTSGAVMSSVTYNLGVDGNFTEEITFVATDQAWNNRCSAASGWANDLMAGAFSSTPQVPGYAGGVQRRQFFNKSGSTVPSIIPEGKNRLQSISISADFGREDLFELGSKGPFAKVASFPIEVTCSIEVLSSGGHFVNAMAESCSYTGQSCSTSSNLSDQTIYIALCDGTVFDLGTKNKLSSVSYGGGDAGGGNVTTTFDFVTYNKLSISGTGTVNFT